MLRRFNYTGRKKINRSAVRLTLTRRDNEPPAFDAAIRLDGLNLPAAARVYVEAYYHESYMRFDFGRVGDIRPPADRRLTDIDAGASALFRVKVIDESGEHGRILAEADGLSPLDSEEAAANREPLLPVVTADLGHAVWKLDFADDRPVLVLNRLIDNIHMTARGDDAFFALVYPAVVQRILLHILRVEQHYDVDGDDWRCQWLRFVCQLPGVSPPPKPANDEEFDQMCDRHLEWIDGAVLAFCERQTGATGSSAPTPPGGNPCPLSGN
jgi:hypothetical protein